MGLPTLEMHIAAIDHFRATMHPSNDQPSERALPPAAISVDETNETEDKCETPRKVFPGL